MAIYQMQLKKILLGCHDLNIHALVQFAGQQCLKFRYHMYGADMGRLSVYIQYGSELPQAPYWTKRGNQGNAWLVGEVNLNPSQPFRVC